jgi:hypothetical protein
MKEAKLVFCADLARRLLKNGHRIIDIKPHRENRDRTVFVFEVTEEFLNDLEKEIQ